MIISKTKPAFVSDKNQALVMLEDGIWRAVRGKKTSDGYKHVFTFNHDGYQYTVDGESFKALYDDTPPEEAAATAIRFNISFLSQKNKLKVPDSVRLAQLAQIQADTEDAVRRRRRQVQELIDTDRRMRRR